MIDYDRPTRSCLISALIAGVFIVVLGVAAAASHSTRRVEASVAAACALVVTVAFLIGAWLYGTGRRTRSDVHRAVDAQTIRRSRPLK